MKSYFGGIDLHVRSNVDHGVITISIRISDLKRSLPERMTVHVPHPAGAKARRVSTGTYDPDREAVLIDGCEAEVCLEVNW
jgi:hypothetical protein